MAEEVKISYIWKMPTDWNGAETRVVWRKMFPRDPVEGYLCLQLSSPRRVSPPATSSTGEGLQNCEYIANLGRHLKWICISQLRVSEAEAV